MSKLVKLFVLLLSLTGLGLWGGTAYAVTCTSTASGGNWNATGTWTGCTGGNGPVANTPGSNDTAVIATTGANVVAANVSITVGNVVINSGKLNVGGSNWTVNGATTVKNSGTIDQTSTGGSATFVGLVTVNGGGTWASTASESCTFRGGITNYGIFNSGTGTYTFNTNNQAIGGTSPINFGGSVAVANGITVTNNNTNVVTIAGNLTGGNSSSTWVNNTNSTLNYGGATGPMGSRVFIASAAGNTVNYIGAAQDVDATTYYHLILSGSSTKIMPATATVTGDFTVSSGVSVTAGASLTVGGNWIEAGTFDPGSRAVTLNGANAQTISGTSTVNFYNLTVTNGASPNITLASNVMVANTLTGTVTLTSTCPTDYKLSSNSPMQTLHSCPPAPPTVTSIAPARGPTAGGTAVTITGTNFTGATAVTIGGASATSIVVGNATTITAVTPPGTAGARDVVVTTPYGSGTGTGLFTYVAAPIAEYRFDEGSAGSVTDSSGNGLSGTLNGGVTVGGSGQVCTGYNFNGSNAFVSVPNTALLNPTQITVAAWVRHNTATIKNWETILAKGDSAYRLHLNGGCSINGNNTLGGLSFAVNGGCAGADVNSGIVPIAGTWYHVVGTYDGATIKIYVNGTLAASGAYASSLGSNTYPLNIGENAQQTGRYWSGDIDEVKIYGVAFSAGQIAAGYANEHAGKDWDGTTRLCLISAPHHLEIQHASGSGLTCAASTLSIKACSDAACTTPYTRGVSGTLSATGTPTVNWDGGTGGAAGAGFVIPSGSSSVTKNVQVATAGSVLFGITSPAPAPSNVTACNFGSPACTFTANTAGFIYANSSTGGSYTIPPQFSGSAAVGLYLRAVQASTTNPAVCTPAIISSTTAVNMGYACNNPATCQAGNLAAINAIAIAPGGTSVSLAFDANGSAPITARYDDVGQITLSANKTVTPTGGTAVTLNGSSNLFVVAPHHFGFSNITSGLIKAGNSFSATVTAYNGLATPSVTGNFGKEAAPEGVTLTPSLVSLVGGNNPAIGNNSIPGSEFGAGGMVVDSNGVATVNNLSWGEVGLIKLIANLTSGSYLGSALTATGTSGNVGRFIPHHFDTVLTQPGTTFTYSGQPFTTKVTAMNFAGAPTTNYNATAGFSKDVTLSAWDSTGVIANPGPGALTPTQPPVIVSASAFTSTSTGAATVATPIFTFSTAKTAPMTIRIRATDTDLVSSSDGVTEGTAVIRSGRLRVSNAFGSEKSNLSMAINAEYWTGLSWLLNSDDSFSLIPIAAIALNPSGVTGSTVQNPVTLTSGKGSIVLLKPTSGTGMIDLAINLGSGTSDLSCLTTHPASVGAGLPWLRSLNGSCAATYDRDPSARATFGIYSPETRKTIHIRELY